MKKKLFVIVGPTASGKTSLSITLADMLNTEIVSADSRQFYREMSIGTAKPTDDELGKVKHHFINSLSIQDEYNAGMYETQSLKCVSGIFEKKNFCLLVGGSGLFVNAVCYGFDQLPSTDAELRKNLSEQLLNNGIESLRLQLKALDPESYKQIDVANPQRVMRALEVCLTTGLPYSSFKKGEKKIRPFETVMLGLDMPREKLYSRINSRVDKMMEQNLLEEVKTLFEFRHLNPLQTVGYSELFEFLENKLSFEKAVEDIKQNSRNYAKRQLTWFRKDKNIHWFDAEKEDDVLKFIKNQTG